MTRSTATTLIGWSTCVRGREVAHRAEVKDAIDAALEQGLQRVRAREIGRDVLDAEPVEEGLALTAAIGGPHGGALLAQVLDHVPADEAGGAGHERDLLVAHGDVRPKVVSR